MAEDENKADELDEEAEGGGSGKKKLFLIIGVVALLLIGVAGAAFFLMGDDSAEENTEEAAEVEEEEEGEKIAQYHAIPPAKASGMVISLLPGTGFKQAQVSLRVFTYSEALVDYLKQNDPMIRHHILNTLSTEESSKFMSKAGREQLQAALKKTLVDMLSESKVEEEKKLSNKVEEIYFTGFVLQ